jgi:hypothetical protein
MRTDSTLLLLLLAALPSCTPGLETEPEVAVIPRGKLDDYRSTVGAEYDVSGEAILRLTGDDATLEGEARAERARTLAQGLVSVITDAMRNRLTSLFPEEEKKKKKDGVVVYLRNSSKGYDELRAEGDLYRLRYRAEVVATLAFLDRLPLEPQPDGARALPVEIGAGEEKQVVALRFTLSPEVKDAYPRYLELFEDGLDLYVHYGEDYNAERYDLQEARGFYDKLLALGFRSKVASFDELRLDSPALESELDVGGTTPRKVPVRVRIVHADMVPDTELDKLIDAYKQGAASADVVVYNGHASEDTSYSGVVVHYTNGLRKALRADDFVNLDLPERYQIFLFAGCHTYGGYADRLLANPKKAGKNASVITAANTTPLSREITSVLLARLLDQSRGTWFPRSWDALVKPLNDETEKSWIAIYGVHGLADSPRISPLADPSTVGQPCSRKADCPGVDNLCVAAAPGAGRVCGAACTDSSGCPAGSRCELVGVSLLGFPLSAPALQCVP